MNQYNPYLHPFGPGQVGPASPHTPEIDDAYELESPVASIHVFAPSSGGPQGASVPVHAELAQPHPPAYGRPQKFAVSATSAIVSMILGIVSMASFFLGLSIFPAIGAIITGHFGLSRIKRSAGALTGKGMAITGLITGYMGLVLSLIVIGLFVNLIMNRPSRQQVAHIKLTEAERQALIEEEETFRAKAASESVLDKIEKKLERAAQNTARGNSPEAIELAKLFNAHVQKLKPKEPNDFPELEAMKGFTYATHCELHPDRVAFLVRIHGSDRATNSTKKALKSFCWISAAYGMNQSVSDKHHLAISLRDSSGTFSIQHGKMREHQPHSELERDSLLVFYAKSDEELLDLSMLPEASIPGYRVHPGHQSFEKTFARPNPVGTPRDGFGHPIGSPHDRFDNSVNTHPSDTQYGFRAREHFPTAKPVADPLKNIPVAGFRQSAPFIPLYRGETLELDLLKYSPLVIDTSPGNKQFSFSGADISVARFSPDGLRLGVGVEDGRVTLYHLPESDYTHLKFFDGPACDVTALAFSPDGAKIYAAGQYGKIISTSTTTTFATQPTMEELLKQRQTTPCMAVSPDGQWLFSGNGHQLNWQQTDLPRENHASSDLKFELQNINVDKHGTKVYYTDGMQLIRLDVKSQQFQSLGSWNKLPELPCDISSAAGLIATKTSENIELRKLNKPNEHTSIPFSGSRTTLRFTPDGERLVAVEKDCVYVWDLGIDKLVVKYKLPNASAMVLRDISPDGKFAAIQAHARGTRLYVVRLPDTLPGIAGMLIKAFPPQPRKDMPNPASAPAPGQVPDSTQGMQTIQVLDHSEAVFKNLPMGSFSLAFSASGNSLVAGKSNGIILHFDLTTKQEQTLTNNLSGVVTALCYGDEDLKLFAGDSKGKLLALDLAPDGKIIKEHELTGHKALISSLVLSRSGKFLLSAGEDRTVRWQQLAGLRQVRELVLPDGSVSSLREKPGESLVYATDGRRFIAIELRPAIHTSDRVVSQLGEACCEISRDAKLVATVSGTSISLYNLEQKKLLSRIKTDQKMVGLCFTHDNRYLLAAGRGTISVYDLNTRAQVALYVFPDSNGVYRMTLSPDGKRMAAYSDAVGKNLFIFPLSALNTSP